MNSVVKSVRGRARNKAVCSEDEPNNKKPSIRRAAGGRQGCTSMSCVGWSVVMSRVRKGLKYLKWHIHGLQFIDTHKGKSIMFQM